MADSVNLESLYQKIARGEDVRESLISLRERIRDESLRRKFMYLLGGDFSVLTGLLHDADPKVRKNAALILGQTEDEDVLPELVRAWKSEKTLFVREDYLRAMEQLDFRAYLPDLRERLAEIENAPSGNGQPGSLQDSGNALWDNGKHLEAEGSRIRRMLERCGERKRHVFTRKSPAPDLMLLCNRCQTNVTAEQIRTGIVREMRGGVFVKRGSLDELMTIRTWSECLFPVPGIRTVPSDPGKAAQALHEGKLYGYLRYLHGEEEGPYRYRVELKGSIARSGKKGPFIRALTGRLDMLEKGKVQNDDGSYEAELRLIERSDGTFAPMLKLFTIRDQRFGYRKETTAQSMSPVNAALAIRLALPYLKDDAQVLDPFCGTGTLLIERELVHTLHPCRSLYGVDRFGDAVRKARVNSEPFGTVHYVNRDFFDFTHDYLFDELITEFPSADQTAGGTFFTRFFEKASSLLADEAVIAAVTRRPEELVKASESADLSGGSCTLLRKYPLNERLGTTELIFRFQKSDNFRLDNRESR